MKDVEEYKAHVRKESIRLREFDYKGEYNYFITCVCKDHRWTFYPSPLANDIIETLLNTADDKGFNVICYCLMPDHIHFVVHGNLDGADLVKFMQLFKQRSECIGKKKGIGKIWRRSYYDHVIRKYESLANILKYVLDNPFRAGLVEEGEEYPLARLLTEYL